MNVTHGAFVRTSQTEKARGGGWGALICLQKELWLHGLNRSGLDKS